MTDWSIIIVILKKSLTLTVHAEDYVKLNVTAPNCKRHSVAARSYREAELNHGRLKWSVRPRVKTFYRNSILYLPTTTSLYSASYLGRQHDTARICCWAPCCGAVAAECRCPLLSIVSCPHGAKQQTHRTPLLLSIDGTDRRTDGRTIDRFIDSAYYAGSVSKYFCHSIYIYIRVVKFRLNVLHVYGRAGDGANVWVRRYWWPIMCCLLALSVDKS